MLLQFNGNLYENVTVFQDKHFMIRLRQPHFAHFSKLAHLIQPSYSHTMLYNIIKSGLWSQNILAHSSGSLKGTETEAAALSWSLGGARLQDFKSANVKAEHKILKVVWSMSLEQYNAMQMCRIHTCTTDKELQIKKMAMLSLKLKRLVTVIRRPMSFASHA